MKLHMAVIAACFWLGGPARSQAGPPDVTPPAKVNFIVPPEIFIHHTAERSFIGPGTILLKDNDLLMAAPWGRPPTNFEEVAAKFPVPMLYRSRDGGRLWKEDGRMKMEWKLPGLISDDDRSTAAVASWRCPASATSPPSPRFSSRRVRLDQSPPSSITPRSRWSTR